jgi:oligopeptidase A
MYLKSKGEEPPEMDPEAGPWRITHDMPSYIAAMQHLPSRSLREQIYRAYITRAGETFEDKNNVPLIYEILKIKTEMSKMLGFKNAAERSLATKMAPTVEAVQELSDLIREKALPAAERELAEITAFARENGGEDYSEEKLEKLMPWDTTFWSERLKESKFDLTEEELRPYFALPNVLDGMFGLLERIFGVTVEEAEGEAEVWHPDVKFFKVFDVESKKHIASFYLDPFSRPENKRGGAWMDVCVGKSEAVKSDVPVAYLTCNGSPPVGNKPSLMTFREVETLFHETGKEKKPIVFVLFYPRIQLSIVFVIQRTRTSAHVDQGICWGRRWDQRSRMGRRGIAFSGKLHAMKMCLQLVRCFVLLTSLAPESSWKTGATIAQLFMGLPNTGRLENLYQKKCSRS